LLAMEYLGDMSRVHVKPEQEAVAFEAPQVQVQQAATAEESTSVVTFAGAGICTSCGGVTKPNGTCHVCIECGATTGCS
jgi:ribonucleoside-diphosphate reductase alpha chain